MAYDWSAGEEITSAKLDLTGLPYAVATGSANAYAVDFTPDLTLAAGLRLAFKANHDNTSAATLAVDGSAAKSVKKNSNQDVKDGDIKNGQVVVVVYDGTNFQMVSETFDSRLLTTFTTNVTVGNTSTETTIVSATVPGGTLGTNRAIKGRIYIQSFRNHPNGVLGIYLRYNNAIAASIVISNSVAFSSVQKGYIDFMLLANGATNAQEGSISWVTYVNQEIKQASAGSAAAIEMITHANEGTAAEDSTSDKTLVVTAQWGVAEVNNTVTFGHAIIEMVR